MLLDLVKAGSEDYSTSVRVVDAADGTPEQGVAYDTTGIALWYRRKGAAKVAITPATLAALTTAHTDGGFLHVDDGVCRLDLPDAAIAAGVPYVDIGGAFTDMIVIGGRIRLTAIDVDNASTAGLSVFYNFFAQKNVDHTEDELFNMVLTDDTAATGKTLTVTRSIDGGAFAAVNGSTAVAEVSAGVYKFTTIKAVDLNGDDIVFRCAATGCKDTFINFKTLA